MVSSIRLPVVGFSSSQVVLYLYTKKFFRNLIKSNRNQIVFTIFRLIWNQSDDRLVPSQSVHGKYNLISVWFNQITKIFLCVCMKRKIFLIPFKYIGIWSQWQFSFWLRKCNYELNWILFGSYLKGKLSLRSLRKTVKKNYKSSDGRKFFSSPGNIKY